MQKWLKIDKAVVILNERKNKIVHLVPDPFQIEEYSEIINALLILRDYQLTNSH